MGRKRGQRVVPPVERSADAAAAAAAQPLDAIFGATAVADAAQRDSLAISDDTPPPDRLARPSAPTPSRAVDFPGTPTAPPGAGDLQERTPSSSGDAYDVTTHLRSAASPAAGGPSRAAREAGFAAAAKAAADGDCSAGGVALSGSGHVATYSAASPLSSHIQMSAAADSALVSDETPTVQALSRRSSTDHSHGGSLSGGLARLRGDFDDAALPTAIEAELPQPPVSPVVAGGREAPPQTGPPNCSPADNGRLDADGGLWWSTIRNFVGELDDRDESVASAATRPHTPMQEVGGASGRLTFSFAAAGWLQTYHFGVAKAIVDAGLHRPDTLYAGSSAGALAAAAIVSHTDLADMLEYAVWAQKDCHRSLRNAFNIRYYVEHGIETYAVSRYREDPEGTRRLLNGQLEVHATVLPWLKAKCFTRFDTPEDLQEALTASCLITPLAGLPFRLRATGEWVVDGGLRAFQPRKKEPNTICVSALYFDSADIKPSRYVPAHWGLYPPGETAYRELFALGYNDCLEFFVRRGTITHAAAEALAAGYPLPSIDGALFPALGFAAGVPTPLSSAPASHCPTPLSKPPPTADEFPGAAAPGPGSAARRHHSRVHSCTSAASFESIPSVMRATAAGIATRRSLPARFARRLIGVGAAASELVVDLAAFVVFVCWLRPLGLFLVYAEMAAVAAVTFSLALLHDVTPMWVTRLWVSGRKARRAAEGTRRAAWADAYHAARNLVSWRNPLHFLLGHKVSVNTERLRSYSRMYRVFQPVWTRKGAKLS